MRWEGCEHLDAESLSAKRGLCRGGLSPRWRSIINVSIPTCLVRDPVKAMEGRATEGD